MHCGVLIQVDDVRMKVMQNSSFPILSKWLAAFQHHVLSSATVKAISSKHQIVSGDKSSARRFKQNLLKHIWGNRIDFNKTTVEFVGLKGFREVDIYIFSLLYHCFSKLRKMAIFQKQRTNWFLFFGVSLKFLLSNA